MKVQGLDGKNYSWNLTGYGIKRGNCSSYHKRARELLADEFPTLSILEEVALPGFKNALFADFYLPLKKLLVEVQGEQHYKYIDRLHADAVGSKKNFLLGQKRDREKRQWCELNNITLVELTYEETDDEWRSKIRNR